MGACDVAASWVASAGSRLAAACKLSAPLFSRRRRLQFGLLLIALLVEFLANVALADSGETWPLLTHTKQQQQQQQYASFVNQQQADGDDDKPRHLSSFAGRHQKPSPPPPPHKRTTNHAQRLERRRQFQSEPETSNSSWPLTSRRGRRRRALKSKREAALELAVSRLHVLESLDEQLRQFADAAAASVDAKRASPSSGRSCALRLKFGLEAESEAASEPEPEPELGPPACEAAGEKWARRVPPYMLNVYQQLKLESSSLAEAVRSMPYKSLVMRSFRQPEGEYLTLVYQVGVAVHPFSKSRA